jgi:uncharacterized membrane protein
MAFNPLDILWGIWQFIKDLYMIFTNLDKMVKFTNFSLFLIFAPYLVKIIPFPFQYMMAKMKEKKDKAAFSKNLAAFDQKINTQIDSGAKIQINEEQYSYLPQATKDRLKNMQKGGAGALSVFMSSPGFIEYIQTLFFIVFIYYWEASEKCNDADDKKRKELEQITGNLKKGKTDRADAQAKIDALGYSFKQLFWDGLYTAMIPMIFYFGYYTFLVFLPFVGLGLKIIQMIPIINKIFGGTLIYFFYNIMRNFREVTKRNKCN